MDLIDAQAWLRGERDCTNIIPDHPFDTWQLRIAQSNAAMMQQAYFVAKAHAEGLAGAAP